MSNNTQKEFLEICQSIKREGVENLIKFLLDSSFFSDPASTNGHNSYEGGLADHCLNVYKILNNYKRLYPELEKLDESLKIIGLFHDLGYVGCYQKINKNLPLKGADGKNKRDSQGKLIFIEKESFDLYADNQLPYPQNQLNLIMLKQYIKLTKLEDLSILWQKGFQDYSSNIWPTIDRAFKKHKLIFLTYMAKKEAILFHDLKSER